MKRSSLFALLLAVLLIFSTVLSLAACGTTPAGTDDNGGSNNNNNNNNNGTSSADGKINVKFFKVGKANATLIRTPDGNILIDCGEEEDEDGNGKQDDGEKILEYLAGKGVTTIDLLVVSQFNKNHYGSVPTILEGVTVKKVIEPAYTKDGNTYTAYREALTKANLTPEVISAEKTITLGDSSLTFYPATTPSSTADADEYNSLAVAFEYGDFGVLVASDIFGSRTTALIESLGGKTFDILQVPYHGTFNDTVDDLLDAVKPDYAVIFASANNPEDVRTVNLLTARNITYYVTKNGAVEAKFQGTLTVKQ